MYCDLPSLSDAALSSLETRPPRSRGGLGRGGRRPTTTTTPATAALSLAAERGGRGAGSGRPDGKRLRDDQFRGRCLKWLRPRLPMAWVLNQVLLGRVRWEGAGEGGGSGGSGGGGGGGGEEEKGEEGGGGEEKEKQRFAAVDRGLGISLVSSLLARTQ